ncbi:hypothetical protein IWQ60_004707 [Tieghemiomyces parasiticus]|uniref:AB hydrolase-1 domain-containing protein n=1 Tax=Tieghemiomyces parasiticus TaxID=78921 RepID=A0A9W8ADT6_9FUNG|nr:hypothetical protein IWQ60_004707 [Tieghemiomyces parasiticus]
MEPPRLDRPSVDGTVEAEPLLANLPQVLLIDTLVRQAYFTVPAGPNEGTEAFRIYYELHGRGPRRVVFIGGFGMGLVGWENQIRYFASQPGYQVLVLDSRGAGWSDTPSGLYTTKTMAHDVLGLLDHVGWTADVHVVGVSLGGMVAQEMAVEGDLGRFASLTFVSTTPGRRCFPLSTSCHFVRLMITQDPKEKLRLAQGLMFPTFWLDQPCKELEGHPQLAGRVRTNLDFIREGGLDRGRFTRLQTFNGFLAQLSASLRHWASAEQLQPLRDHPRVRCLILTGTDDRMIPCADSLLLASHLRAPTLVFPGSGHVLPLEQTRRFNAVLDRQFSGADVIGI